MILDRKELLALCIAVSKRMANRTFRPGPISATTAAAIVVASVFLADQSASQPAGPPAMRHNLPYSEGRSFETLDDYLAFLRERSAIGVPYYREVAPGRYERVESIRPGGRVPASQSREDLEAKYGFSRKRP